MIGNGRSRLAEVLRRHEKDILAEWTKGQEDELRDQAAEFLRLLAEAAQNGNLADATAPSWAPVREVLASVSESRGRRGFAPSETATFVLSLKEPIFGRLRQALADDPQALADEIWAATLLLDQLSLYSIEIYQKGREALIARQQQEMIELSTPVVKLWEGVLALPLIGTLDSARTQVVMESLLQRIVETGSSLAIIDITGVPMVDTLVAQHLLKTVAAARLMGADCIISGIRPQIAQTIVHLGVELTDVVTKATLADAFDVALKRQGLTVTRAGARG